MTTKTEKKAEPPKQIEKNTATIFLSDYFRKNYS
jgi:hypothetical protein